MSDAQASEAARARAAARWGTQRLDAAVDLVVERAEQLGDAQRAQLREAAADPADGREAGQHG
jgi:hypothetical protein